MYYLQSRYYNPHIGRFINADALVATGQGFVGNNMFAYCLNTPVNGCDPCGSCFHRWDIWNDCEKCGGKTIKEKWNQVTTSIQKATKSIRNRIGRTDEKMVQQDLKKSNVSLYNGTLVYMTDLPFDGSAFSFGVIVLDDYYGDVSDKFFSDTLNHEYGHSIHFRQVGVVTYLITTAIPSLIGAGLSNVSATVYENYYSLPWERTADYLGGVNRTYAPGANTLGSIFWWYTIFSSVQ